MSESSFEDLLRRDYPRLYPSALPSSMLDVPPGWQRIVRDLSERLKDEPIQCLQVKEKFGGLRWYFKGSASAVLSEALMDAEDESWVTCDRCGDVGRLLVREGWYMVRCPEHADGSVPVDPLCHAGLPVALAGFHAPRRAGIARGFVTLDEVYHSSGRYCPECGADWRADPIPEDRQWLYGVTHGRRLISIYDRELDRTIYYVCPDCDAHFSPAAVELWERRRLYLERLSEPERRRILHHAVRAARRKLQEARKVAVAASDQTVVTAERQLESIVREYRGWFDDEP